MNKRRIVLPVFVLLTATAFLHAAEIRILPSRLNPNGKRAMMKAEIRDLDTSTVDTTNITLNGIPAVRTRVTSKKVAAFFPKNAVIATLGDVQKGQTYTLSVAFSAGAQQSTMTDDIKIVGKKKNKP